MVRIITDSSALFNAKQAKEMGIDMIPLRINIKDKDYRDLEISCEEFVSIINEGYVPKSSQPPIGELLEIYDSYQNEEILNICMADGLSGTYQSALSVKEQSTNCDNITVLNSETLCGPHRYLVEKAIKLNNENVSLENIIKGLKESMAKCESFLIPSDFDFLKRGGRLKPAAATLGGLLKLKPVMKQVDNGTRLDTFGIKRTMKSVVNSIIEYFKEANIDENYKIYVSYNQIKEEAEIAIARLKEAFDNIEIEMLEVSPAFITQGGPNLIAIQYIKK